MRSRAPWGQMVVATMVVLVLPAVLVGALDTLGVISALWVEVLLAVALSSAFTSAGSAYWRRHATGDVLFSDLLVWRWLRRGRMERRLGRADDLLERVGTADAEGKAKLLRDLGVALDAQDPYLYGHSRRVARYATMTASRLDVPAEGVERVRTAAMIHDIGKLHVAPEIVNKPGRLTDDEFDLMKQHAGEGGSMVECLGDPPLAAVVRAHHERWDGSGYPDGLAGGRIPPEARIISVVDTFDAITSARSYRPAAPHAKALNIIKEEAGHQLDPDAVHAFVSCYSDRRGAARWAVIAFVSRLVAARLAIAPAEIAGLLAAPFVAPLVVLAGSMGAEALPMTSGPPGRPPALRQPAASTAEATATASAQPTATPSAARTAGTSSPQTARNTRTPRAARNTRTPQAAGGVAGAQATSTPTPEPTAPTSPTPAPTPTATPSHEPSAGAGPTPEPLPPLVPVTLPVLPEATPGDAGPP